MRSNVVAAGMNSHEPVHRIMTSLLENASLNADISEASRAFPDWEYPISLERRTPGVSSAGAVF